VANNFIGLDAGQARVGFALGNDAAKLASPLRSEPTEQAIKKLKELIVEHSSAGLVVGLPRSLSGDETEQTAWVREWVDKLKAHVELPIYAQDEALTTKLAEAQALATKKPQDTDALAAAIILQDFLDSAEAEKVTW
jgi:putative Holliday junction resolvase